MTLDEERARLQAWQEHLERTVANHAEKLEALSTVPGALTAMDRRLWESERTLKDVVASLEKNTAVTTSIREAQIAGQAVAGASKWVASFVAGVIAILAGLATAWAVYRGGKP